MDEREEFLRILLIQIGLFTVVFTILFSVIGLVKFLV
jgi:hypothetical protein